MTAAATTRYPLPDVAQVRELLGMLFDGITVKAGAKLDPAPKGKPYFGFYVADDGSPAGLVGCDLAFASNSGAALSMLPPNAAKDAVKTKELTDVMIANLREVMNICTRLLLKESSPHVRLLLVSEVAGLPPPAAAIISAPNGRVDFEIGLGKYGSGLLAVLAM
jgi:hypothetical protein